MRCFISIEIPDEIKSKIRKIQDKLPEFYGKKTEIDNLHLTLKFLGELSEEKINKVKEKLSEIKLKRFKTKIDSMGFFSPKSIRIIWLHLTNCDDLQKQIDDKLKDLFERERRFMSHLTIARVKKINNKQKFLKDIKNIHVLEINFFVKSFKLKRSTLTEKGPIYETIEEYLLK